MYSTTTEKKSRPDVHAQQREERSDRRKENGEIEGQKEREIQILICIYYPRT